MLKHWQNTWKLGARMVKIPVFKQLDAEFIQLLLEKPYRNYEQILREMPTYQEQHIRQGNKKP